MEPHKKKLNILLVGIGGGGSCMAPTLATMCDKLIIADGDKFEDKNKARQPFAETNKFKAKVFAEKLGKYNVVAHPKYLKGDEQFGELDYIISCVDNNAARAAVRDLSDTHLCPLIICANETWSPMSWLYHPLWKDTHLDPFERWDLTNLTEQEVSCDGEIVVPVEEQTADANLASAGLGITILRSTTMKSKRLWIAEASSDPFPKYKLAKDLEE